MEAAKEQLEKLDKEYKSTLRNLWILLIADIVCNSLLIFLFRDSFSPTLVYPGLFSVTLCVLSIYLLKKYY